MALFKKGWFKKVGRGISRFTKKPFFKKALGFGSQFIPGAGPLISGLGGLFGGKKKQSAGNSEGAAPQPVGPQLQSVTSPAFSNFTYDNRTFMLALIAAAVVAYKSFSK